MWYIIARKDESHVLSRTPAPDVRMQGQTQENENSSKTRIRIKPRCGTETGPLTRGKEPPQIARNPDPGKENPNATSDSNVDQAIWHRVCAYLKSRLSKENIPTSVASRMRSLEPQSWLQIRLRIGFQGSRAEKKGMWRFNRKRGNHMMLDNKSSQK